MSLAEYQILHIALTLCTLWTAKLKSLLLRRLGVNVLNTSPSHSNDTAPYSHIVCVWGRSLSLWILAVLGIHDVDQVDLELVVILPLLPLKCWDSRCGPPSLTLPSLLFLFVFLRQGLSGWAWIHKPVSAFWVLGLHSCSTISSYIITVIIILRFMLGLIVYAFNPSTGGRGKHISMSQGQPDLHRVPGQPELYTYIHELCICLVPETVITGVINSYECWKLNSGLLQDY